jgi:MoxR-like ATPase
MPMKKQKQELKKYTAAESILEKEGYYIFYPDESPLKTQPVEERADLDREKQSQFVIREQVEKKPVITPDIPIEITEEKVVHYDLSTITSYLKWHMDRISKNVIGREEIVKQAMYAILTREHLLLLSRTGMAKSYLANYIFNTFENVRIFSSQASKDQTPDNYFGPYNIEEFKKGNIRHNIHGSIIEADLVFLDEFFDASDVVLRSLLSVLHERKFINGPEIIDAAVHSAIATANYMRVNEVTEAVLDRFNYKSIIPEDTNMYTQLLIDHTYAFSRGKPTEPAKKIPFNQIIYISDIIKNNNKEIQIIIPDTVYFMKNVITNKFISEMRRSEYNFFISPRKQAKSADFLRASALLDNRYEVNLEDVKNLHLMLCTLNSYVSVKAKDKSEKDVFLDVYDQTMVHFKTTGAIEQLEFLLNVRRIFQELSENPEKRESVQQTGGLLQGLRKLFKRIFPTKSKVNEDEITLEILKNSVSEINPAVEEVRELREGILKDFKYIL